MKCPYCNEELTSEDICQSCKKDIHVYIKTVKASNAYYNSGLRKAQIRDLTNAINDLKNSIKLNKANYQARNLLGLIYYEIGEVVEALTQWVLSKHYNPDNELAETYLNDIQASPTKVDSYNQSFRKFNLALQAAKQGNLDLAVIHLKKVISLNEKYLKAMHLLALVYIKQEQYAKAKKILLTAQKIDITNDTTLLYIAEVKANINEEAEEKNRRKKNIYASLAPMDMYKEEKTNMATFVNLIIGILIGIAVVGVLVIPSIKQKSEKEYNRKVVRDSDNNTSVSVEMTKLEENIKDLKSELGKKQKEVEAYENKVDYLKMYDSLLKASRHFISGDKKSAALELAKINKDKFELDDAGVLYDYIKDEVYDSVMRDLAEEGRRKCNSGKLEEALVVLKQAYQLSKENETVLYFLGRTYQKLDKKDDAKKYYEELIKKFPNASRASTAKKRIREMGFEYNENTAEEDNNDGGEEDTQN